MQYCFLVLAFTLLSCLTSHRSAPHVDNTGDQGFVVLTSVAYGPIPKTDSVTMLFSVNQNRWFYKNLTIEEEIIQKQVTENGITNTLNEVICYLFNYAPAGRVFEFLTFSDTATLLQHFDIQDSVNLRGGSKYWGRSKNPRVQSWEKSILLSDTIIRGHSYKRLRQKVVTVNSQKVLLDYMLRCDIHINLLGGIKTMDSIEHRIDCTPTKVVAYDEQNSKYLYNVIDLSIVRDSLSDYEKAVFAAWEARAKKVLETEN